MDNKQAALELGQKPVGQLLWQYALPAIVAMTASSLYNIIDRAMIVRLWVRKPLRVWASHSHL